MPRYITAAKTNLMLRPEAVWQAIKDPRHPMWEKSGAEFSPAGPLGQNSRLNVSCRLGNFCLKIEQMSYSRRRESGLIVACLENAADYRLLAADKLISIAPEEGGSSIGVEVGLEFRPLMAFAAMACGRLLEDRLQAGLDSAAKRFEDMVAVAAD